MPLPVVIPLLNPNEPEAALVAVHVTEGQRVAVGDLLFTLETTKTTADVTAEGDGYVVGLHSVRGQTVRAGDVLCYLVDSPDWKPPIVETPRRGVSTGLRITQPALALAQRSGLDLSKLPVGPLVTEKMIQELLEKVSGPDLSVSENASDPTAIVIYGGGGHGKSLIDLLRVLGTYRIVGVVDDGMAVGETVMGVPVLGGSSVLAGLHAQGVHLAVNAVGGIGNIAVRVKVFRQLAEAGFTCPGLVHPTALVEPSAQLSAGVQIFPHAYVGSEVQIGFGTIINTGAIVSHDCHLSDYVNISPGAMLAGGVQVGECVLVGMGVTVNLNVKIGDGARVGNSATVKSDVPPNGVVRAGTTFP
jgi:acetyltransferase EpsM